MRTTSTVSSFLSGETTFAVRHLAWNGKRDFVFQIVIPAQGLLFRSGIDDSFVVDSVFTNRVFFGVSSSLWVPECGARRCGSSAVGERSRTC